MSNISDYILEQYYKDVYPKNLNTKRITIPEKFGEYAGKFTYLGISRKVTFESDPKIVLKVLHQQATKIHKPLEVNTPTEVINFSKSEGELLSEYALRVFKDTHALDNGTKLRTKLNKFLQETYGSTDLENIGITSNHAASTVWSKGVTASYGYSGVSLLDVNSIPLVQNNTV